MYSNNFNGYEIAEHILRLNPSIASSVPGQKEFSERRSDKERKFISTGLL